MSSEIATWGMIRAKVPAFPAPVAGRENECLTKSEILSLSGGNVHVEGSYGNGECVMLDNVLANVITWEYTFSVTPTSLSFDATGGTQQVSVTSYKRKHLNGNYTGEQVSVGFSSSASGTGFSSAETSVTAGNNTTTSQRSGTVTFVQYESGKSGYVSCNQAAGVREKRYSISITPNGHVWKMTSTVAFNFIVKCSFDIYINGNLISSTPAEWEVAGLSGYDPDHFTYNIVNGVLAVKPITINTGGYRRAGITVRPAGDYSVRASASLGHDNKL